MKRIGNLTHGLAYIAGLAWHAVTQAGEAALFVAPGGDVYALAYTERGYRRAIRAHGRHCIGVYRDDAALADDPRPLQDEVRAAILGDLVMARRAAA